MCTTMKIRIIIPKIPMLRDVQWLFLLEPLITNLHLRAFLFDVESAKPLKA